ncbi:cadherin-like protein 26 [Pangasianodon hypophthalmus]|uniref:cadherin-like protein 26 n=1 Tax=Pangasianodon hypophthalmus TaxID=310915 RepID=UPI002307130C|nr:cadherin-like protein 26 [Pangasianodon hypophthalmus]
MRTISTIMIILVMTGIGIISTHSKIRQKRTWIIDSFTIEEENPGPHPYILGTINVERSYLVMFFLKGRGVDEEPKDVLSINVRTGELLVHKKVDYETYRNLSFRFEARDERLNLDTRLGVEIKILDINDHAPVFKYPHYEQKLEESAPQGELVTTVSASDGDDPTTPNGTFTFTLESVTPKTDNVEFYITQNNTTGNIYFKGCLDYKKAQKYTLLIKATDKGDKKQLSSTSTLVLNITDKNNHLPVIIGHTGNGTIKERERGVEVLRLKVSDRDSPGSPAWKAKFTLHEDPENYFKIHTDPNTNDGILTVIKAMDYEEQTSRNVSISVENEVPYFFCKVKTRTLWGLWDVETLPKESSTSALYPVTITVQDVNDPPEFVPPVQVRMIKENAKIGTFLGKLTVKDPDKTFGNSFHFVKGEDKNNWVAVDSETGQVLVNKVMDRESPLVNQSTYTVIMYAVTKAQPPQTGTGTLLILLEDENDNVPLLINNTVSMCLSDEKTMTTITAEDPDLTPHTAPFHYELLEDDEMQGKWTIEPKDGRTAYLFKENTVYAGHYKIRIKISDNQGYGSVQKLSITVCDCTSKSGTMTKCDNTVRNFKAQPSLSAIGIMSFAFLLLPVVLLMTLLFCEKRNKSMILPDDVPGNLIRSNTEMPGTDCKVPLEMCQSVMSQSTVKMSNGFSKQHSMLHNDFQGSSATSIENQMLGKSLCRKSMSKNCVTYYIHDDNFKKVLSDRLDQMLLQLHTPERVLSDYKPHCYAYEGEPDENRDENLDTLYIPEIDFHPDILSNLDSRFTNLAAVCRLHVMSKKLG